MPSPWLASLLLLAPGLAGPALAAPLAEPAVRVLEDGQTVEGTVQVALPPDQARAVLLDPWRTAQAAGSELTVEALGPAGACADYRWTVPNAIKTVSYSGRLCPTETGMVCTLLESDDMRSYRGEWWVEPQGEGSLLRYQVLSLPSFALPRPILRAVLKQEVRDMLEHMQRSLGR